MIKRCRAIDTRQVTSRLVTIPAGNKEAIIGQVIRELLGHIPGFGHDPSRRLGATLAPGLHFLLGGLWRVGCR